MLRVSACRRAIFDACYVLNLDRRPDRWAHAQRQIARAKLQKFFKPHVDVTRVSGVDGATLDVAELHRSGVLTDLGYERYQLPTAQKLFGMDLTNGAIGCALGHRAVWQRVVAAQQRCALVLEDDVEFHHRFARQLQERWTRVPADWGVVHLGGLDLLAAGKPPRPYVAEGVRLAYQGHRELTAYVVHAAAAQRCLDLSLPMTWQVDTHISSCLADDPKAQDKYICDPKMYVFQPSLVIQLTSLGTDVQKKAAANPALEDAARRMREFIGGGTSVR
ncbi:putative mitochondrial glycosyltransferase family-like protein [Leptomonas pyrrhocoris]|uniref:Putative mitochondrial glycosyltransferase family-like protein n=1 Tax=Leptomonas pyrrhocoris TaxID=157538 RepID=A0A0N0VDS5_LEPPY|nr:putative mitochondrial glycosyltransferase family-like protein [Leptomonas pyrrhocoris]XP_015654891.1 putative mitochondrial glycosyltransferase family-like protein [Leptomonas pyrrhocoris]KPA76451.1 putative mitochondrial glycosyltransferase family-like protein [Leptomonas pyrrhocoris]KPA76452.1 putative mitochondrial glycosyltransferase family-like protein [Leptomonas pyrrhocoris]|eukprot:XP_015654890.1 putative mitochondrial glycosyltransferase family-like protein [Leptomonas pyrrhocoris]